MLVITNLVTPVLEGAHKMHSQRSIRTSTFHDLCLNNNGHCLVILGLIPQMLDSEHQTPLNSSRNINDQENNSHVIMCLQGAQEIFSLSRDQEQHPHYTILQPRCICIVNSHFNCKLEVTPGILALLFNSEGTLVPKVISANLFQLLLDSAYTKSSL